MGSLAALSSLILSAVLLVTPVLSVAVHDRPAFHHHTIEARAPNYRLAKRYQGQNFFDDFDFYQWEDPTHGMVDYVDAAAAKAAGLAYVQADNTTVIGVDSTTTLKPGQHRQSVRISSKQTYDTGLFIADIYSIPHGCSTWPAYWTLGTGSNWPNAGEVDLIESVHNSVHNSVTLHTGPDCKWNTSPIPLWTTAYVEPPMQAFTGSIAGTTCASSSANNNGCGIYNPDPTSFGSGFNKQAGGIVAHRMDSTGIAVWYFPRQAIPPDITAGKPNPATWSTPVALFSSSSCNIAQNFRGHQIIINISLCGDWSGDASIYRSSGCPGTCAQAVADPKNFKYAQWKIGSISVYQ